MKELISLISTPAMTNDPPTGSMRLGGIQNLSHHFSRKKSSDLTTALPLQKKENFSPHREKSAQTSSQTLPTEPTHKI